MRFCLPRGRLPATAQGDSRDAKERQQGLRRLGRDGEIGDVVRAAVVIEKRALIAIAAEINLQLVVSGQQSRKDVRRAASLRPLLVATTTIALAVSAVEGGIRCKAKVEVRKGTWCRADFVNTPVDVVLAEDITTAVLESQNLARDDHRTTLDEAAEVRPVQRGERVGVRLIGTVEFTGAVEDRVLIGVHKQERTKHAGGPLRSGHGGEADEGEKERACGFHVDLEQIRGGEEFG